ncbi:MAG: hypothetical protein HGB19_12530 [Chlorobiales bacterium]|nr:hypothetical protein [Chlorobiales bacterium]
MKTTIQIHIFIVVLLFSTPLYAKECTQMEAFAAETVIGYLDSWKEIYNAFKSFGHCDDAAIAEGFDDVISIQWGEHWNNVYEMIKYTEENNNFKTFVYKRIGSETIPYDRWEKIVLQAKANCPREAFEFCKEIEKAK